MCNIIREFHRNPDVIPQAFIHDEVIVEIKEESAQKYAQRISELLIDGMHTALPSVRIAVEAEICGDYWKKSGGEWSKKYWKDTPSSILISER